MNLQSSKVFLNDLSILKIFKPVYDIGVTTAWLWPCIFYRFIRVLRRTIIGVTHCGHYASVTKINLQSSKAFSNNPSSKNNFKSVYDIGVTAAGLWPCMFCRLIGVTTPQHCRSNWWRPLRFCRTNEIRDKEGMIELLDVVKQACRERLRLSDVWIFEKHSARSRSRIKIWRWY